MPERSPGDDALVILASESIEVTRTSLQQIERLGGRILHVYPPRLLIGKIPAEVEAQVKALANVTQLHRHRLDPAELDPLGPEAVRAGKAWNRGFAASFRALKSGRPNEGRSWGAPGYAREGPVQPPPGSGSGRAAPSLRPSWEQASLDKDTSAYLIGSVAVNIILVEGRLVPYAFTPIERDNVVAEIQAGLGWLGGLEPRARVSWFYEVRQVTLDLDPTQNAEFSEDTWRNLALAQLGYPPTWAGLERFVRERRTALKTDWTFAIFVTRFPLWHFAYAFKPRVVLGYDCDGWGADDLDRVVAHETAHIFGCADEYAESKCSCTERFGYLQVENGNCELCAPRHVRCIMSHNSWAMCDFTRGQLGWRDSNGDGILDPLDEQVPAPKRTWWESLIKWLLGASWAARQTPSVKRHLPGTKRHP